MADKRLAEQNQRWLLALYTRTSGLQAAIVDELSQCSREKPDVAWDRLDDLLKQAQAVVQYVNHSRVEG